MRDSIFYYKILIILFFFFAACRDHKNNDTQVKSATIVVSDTPVTSSKTIAENLLTDSSYSMFAESLKATDLLDILTKPGPFTVFAPVNRSFKKLPAETLRNWVPTNKDLTDILSYHLVAGLVRRNDLKEGQKLKTFTGGELVIEKTDDTLLVNGTPIIIQDIQASNGIIYQVNDVLIPHNHNPGSN